MQILLFFGAARWAMKTLPAVKRWSGFEVFAVVAEVAVVLAVEGRGTMAFELVMDLAVLEVALEARERGRWSGGMKPEFLGW